MFGFAKKVWKSSQVDVILEQRFGLKVNNTHRSVSQNVIEMDNSKTIEEVSVIVILSLSRSYYMLNRSEQEFSRIEKKIHHYVNTINHMSLENVIDRDFARQATDELNKLVTQQSDKIVHEVKEVIQPPTIKKQKPQEKENKQHTTKTDTYYSKPKPDLKETHIKQLGVIQSTSSKKNISYNSQLSGSATNKPSENSIDAKQESIQDSNPDLKKNSINSSSNKYFYILIVVGLAVLFGYLLLSSAVLEQNQNRFWDEVKASPSKEMYEAYLKEYPNGHYASIAHIKLKQYQSSTPEVRQSQASTTTQQLPVSTMAKLIIRSNVNGDMVKINGEDKGSTRLDIELIAGAYELEVSKSGYHTWKKSLKIKVGSEQVVWAKLTKINSESSINAFRDKLTGMEFIKIPKGCFQMGSNNGEDNEKPVHRVCISQPYYMSKYEVTQGQWQVIMGNNPSKFKKGNDYPVEQINWNDIEIFIKKLNTKTGQTYRLPTEAEWEYACRSGGKEQKYCGGNSLNSLAWYRNNAGGTTHPIGHKQPNDLGLYDMSGNVSEWVQDWADMNFYQNSPTYDPTGPSSSSFRSYRGGTFGNYEKHGKLRSTARSGFPDGRYPFAGFRLSMSYP